MNSSEILAALEEVMSDSSSVELDYGSSDGEQGPSAGEGNQVNSAAKKRKKSSNTRGGQPKSLIWSHFIEEKVEGKITQKCIYCKASVSSRADRLKKHYENCSKRQGTVDDIQAKEVSQQSQSTSRTTNKAQFQGKTVQAKLTNFFAPISQKDIKELDILVAKFWYSANIPFSTANLETWKSLCSKLRPGYEPPSEDRLKTTLLDEVHTELKSDLLKNIKDKQVVVVQDGWSDTHNHPVIAHNIVVEGESFIFNTYDCGTEKKNAEFCENQAEKAIKSLEEEGAKVIALVSDNTNTMISMRRKIDALYPNLLTYGCSSHYLNLLAQDISPKDLCSKIVEVQKYFRSHHDAGGELRKRNGLHPVLPGATRWLSHLGCIDTFLKNRSKYSEISQLENIFELKIIDIVNNVDIFRKAQELQKSLEEITIWLKKCEQNHSNLADSARAWLSLRNSPNLAQFKNKIQNRMDDIVKDVFFSAYLLHPNYKGLLLNPSEKDKAMAYISSKSNEYMVIVAKFISKDREYFPSFLFEPDLVKKISPLAWWKMVENRGLSFPDGFFDFVFQIFSCPPSSASVEGAFSTFNYIQTDVRNRLTQEKIEKLSFCFIALRRLSKKT